MPPSRGIFCFVLNSTTRFSLGAPGPSHLGTGEWINHSFLCPMPPQPHSTQRLSMQQIIDFILELDKLKAVTRKVRPLGIHDRYENSAEHSWQIALLASSLAQYAEPPID